MVPTAMWQFRQPGRVTSKGAPFGENAVDEVGPAAWP